MASKKAAKKKALKKVLKKAPKKAPKTAAKKSQKSASTKASKKASQKASKPKAKSAKKAAVKKPVAKKGSAKAAAGKKEVATKPAAKPAAAVHGAAPKKTPPSPPKVGAESSPARASAGGGVGVAEVHMGHFFSLRPRVNTSFRPDDMRVAKQRLQEESYETIEDAARAVAELALELSQQGVKAPPIGGPRR